MGSPFSIRPPRATTDVALSDGTRTVLRRYGNPDGFRILLSHGNGLAVDLYYPYWSLLLDDFDLVLFDLRNHGWNPVGAFEEHTIPALVRDLEAIGTAVDREYGVKPRAGVYHSVSALAALLSPSCGVSYSALVLFDPPLFRPGARRLEFDLACSRAATMTRNRAVRFPSEHDFLELIRVQPAFGRVASEVFAIMAQTTLRHAAGGGYELRCPRDYEARIMESLPHFSRLVNTGPVCCPIMVVGADPAGNYYFLPACEPDAASGLEYKCLAGTTHLMQLERPRECAALTVSFLKR